MIRLAALLLVLAGCTCDIHIDADLAWMRPPAKPAAPPPAENPDTNVYESRTCYLDDRGLALAESRGWQLVTRIPRAHAAQCIIRRKVVQP